ncbi:MAG: glycogen/starch synthase [Sedimentisphaerales bacterium]|nr:glycogen/starch synthase [Sedimentisphaerales bacterium]
MIRTNVTWIEVHTPELKDKILVSLSMEGCIPELTGDAREANVKGGLGIYFGDKLEGLNAIGMDRAFGCMPLYKKRIVQSIRNGRQHIEYRDVSYEDQPVELVTDSLNNPMQFGAWGWDAKNTFQERQYKVEVYSISRGGTLLYLFYCPEVFDVLYPDDKTHNGYGREQRFLQETVFAECVYELLKTMNIVPDVLHLNEGHVADAAAIIKGDKAFDKTKVVYTNHTVVQAGLERFCVNRLTGGDVGRARYAMRFLQPGYESFWQKFSVQHDSRWFIDFSKGALEICDVANGVSSEHADATQTLFPFYNREVEAVLNGSGDTWIMDELLKPEFKGIALNKRSLFRISAEGKAKSFAEIKKRTANMTDASGNILTKDGVELNPDLPTIWMVRRMVRYKSQLPVLKDIIHVICADRDERIETPFGPMNGLQMQVVVGGIAPEGSSEEGWIEEFVNWMHRPELKGRFVFVPNADSILLKMQAVGADICINCPLPEQEACGTSDQRSARNGGINIATRSGGPFEYIEDGRSGMLVGPYESDMDFYNRAPKDILDKLKQLSDKYYNQNGNSVWMEMKLESYLASSKVTAAAMEQRYADLYAQALHIRKSIVPNISRGRFKIEYIEELPELVLQLHEVIRTFLYHDSPLKKRRSITSTSYFDRTLDSHLYKRPGDSMVSLPVSYIERERFDLFRDFMKRCFGFVENGILPNLVGNSLLFRHNNTDASLLLLRAINNYVERTKDYDFPDTTAERIFPHKKTTVVRYIRHRKFLQPLPKTSIHF